MKTQANKSPARKPTKKTAAQPQRRSKPKITTAKGPAKSKATERTKPVVPTTQTPSKLAAVIEMLKRPSGTTVNDMSTATGWQTHSVRGLLSGTIKKKLGLKLTSVKVGGVRTYRIGA